MRTFIGRLAVAVVVGIALAAFGLVFLPPPYAARSSDGSIEFRHFSRQGIVERTGLVGPFGAGQGRLWFSRDDDDTEYSVALYPTSPGFMSGERAKLLQKVLPLAQAGERIHTKDVSESGRYGYAYEVAGPPTWPHLWCRVYFDGPDVYALTVLAVRGDSLSRRLRAYRFLRSLHFLGRMKPSPTPLPTPPPEAEATGAPTLVGSLVRPRFHLLNGKVVTEGLGFVVNVDQRPVLLTAAQPLARAVRSGGQLGVAIDLAAEVLSVDLLDFATQRNLGTADRLLVCQICRRYAGPPPGDLVAFAVSESHGLVPFSLGDHSPRREQVWVVGPPVRGSAAKLTIRPARISAQTSEPRSFEALLKTPEDHGRWTGAPVLDDEGRVIGKSYCGEGLNGGLVVVCVDPVGMMVKEIKEAREARAEPVF